MLFVVHVVLKYVSIVIFDEKHGFLFELSNRFDVNDENSVPQWFSQMLFLLIGVTALLAGFMEKVRDTKKLWYILAVVGFVLSLDDVATLHEFILQSIHNTYLLDTQPTFLLSAWWVLLPLVLLGSGFLAWRAWTTLPRRTVMLMIAGGLLFVIGKTITDSFANNVSDLFMERGVVQGLEKVFQYTGSILVLFANLDYLERYRTKSITAAMNALKK